MSVKDKVMNEINEVMRDVDEQQIIAAMKLTRKDKRIFVLGAGRSGLQGKSFAMRLMHIGYQVYVIGETITPSIQSGDVLVAISGSGETKSVMQDVSKAKERNVVILGVTSNAQSQLAQLSTAVLIVPGATKADTDVKSIQLLSTLFDQTAHITLDILCLMLSQRDGVNNQSAYNQHNNME